MPLPALTRRRSEKAEAGMPRACLLAAVMPWTVIRHSYSRHRNLPRIPVIRHQLIRYTENQTRLHVHMEFAQHGKMFIRWLGIFYSIMNKYKTLTV